MLASQEGETLWNYWQQQLAGMSFELNLPTDHPRPAIQTYRGASLPFKLSADKVQGLKALSRRHDATLYMVLAAVFQVLLYRYSGQEEMAIGSLAAGRRRADWADLVGYFVNPVVLRADLSGRPSFETFLQRVRKTVLGALDHQDYPFPALVERMQPERDPSRSPIFQVMFAFQKAHVRNEEGLASFALGESGGRIQHGSLRSCDDRSHGRALPIARRQYHRTS
jgi:hypothetical protein